MLAKNILVNADKLNKLESIKNPSIQNKAEIRRLTQGIKSAVKRLDKTKTQFDFRLTKLASEALNRLESNLDMGRFRFANKKDPN